MKPALRTPCFTIVAVIMFVLGMCVQNRLDARRDRKLRRSMHPAARTNLWPHESTGITMVSTPVDAEQQLAALSIQRGENRVTLPRQSKESWDDFCIASETNIAFVAVKVRNDSGDYDFSRLVRIVLPESADSLDSFVLEPLLTARDAELVESRFRIERIVGVTPDASELLLACLFPYQMTSSTAGWAIRNVRYATTTRTFGSVAFDTNESRPRGF